MSKTFTVAVFPDVDQTDTASIVQRLSRYDPTLVFALVLDWQDAVTQAVIVALDTLGISYYILRVPRKGGRGQLWGAVFNVYRYRVAQTMILSGAVPSATLQQIWKYAKQQEIPVCHAPA